MHVCAVVDKVDGGTMVAPYLLDGLKEMQYCFTEWTKSKEVRKVCALLWVCSTCLLLTSWTMYVPLLCGTLHSY